MGKKIVIVMVNRSLTIIRSGQYCPAIRLVMMPPDQSCQLPSSIRICYHAVIYRADALARDSRREKIPTGNYKQIHSAKSSAIYEVTVCHPSRPINLSYT